MSVGCSVTTGVIVLAMGATEFSTTVVFVDFLDALGAATTGVEAVTTGVGTTEEGVLDTEDLEALTMFGYYILLI